MSMVVIDVYFVGCHQYILNMYMNIAEIFLCYELQKLFPLPVDQFVSKTDGQTDGCYVKILINL